MAISYTYDPQAAVPDAWGDAERALNAKFFGVFIHKRYHLPQGEANGVLQPGATSGTQSLTKKFLRSVLDG